MQWFRSIELTGGRVTPIHDPFGVHLVLTAPLDMADWPSRDFIVSTQA